MFAQNCTTADGRVTALTTYAPYGTVLTRTGTSRTTYGYTGEQHDAVTGLLYLRARYYNSALHTFTGRDPWAGDTMRPMTLHGYSYVHNNPLNYVDPTGMFAVKAIKNYIAKICDLREDCIHHVVSKWKSNGAFWNMLRTAKAGDVLVWNEGWFEWSRSPNTFYTFSGEGSNVLDGLFESDAYGNYYEMDLRARELNDIVLGTYDGDWYGFIRWVEANGKPEFYTREGYEFVNGWRSWDGARNTQQLVSGGMMPTLIVLMTVKEGIAIPALAGYCGSLSWAGWHIWMPDFTPAGAVNNWLGTSANDYKVGMGPAWLTMRKLNFRNGDSS